MNLFFIPQPQRCICLTGSADIGRETPVVLCMPQPDERLVLAAGKLFEHVRTEQGPFALYSENSFAPECPVRRPEGYLLNVRGPAVQLAAHDAPGLFYGIQTLRQYLEMPEHPRWRSTIGLNWRCAAIIWICAACFQSSRIF